MKILHTYAVAVIQVTVVLATALVGALGQGLTPAETAQVALVAAGAVAAYLVPLAPKAWRGAFKTGVTILTTILAAIAPVVVDGGWTAQNWVLVVMAGIGALGTEVGVKMRVDAVTT